MRTQVAGVAIRDIAQSDLDEKNLGGSVEGKSSGRCSKKKKPKKGTSGTETVVRQGQYCCGRKLREGIGGKERRKRVDGRKGTLRDGLKMLGLHP